MNIFITDQCPTKSAAYLDDKRVVKMVLESAQLLSTSLTLSGTDGPYKVTHKNHPCAVWARATRGNYWWLFQHFCALLNEYQVRFGKTHKCQSLVGEFRTKVSYIPAGPLQPFANCAGNKSLGIDYTMVEDTTLAYKLYLNDRWDTDKVEPKWTNNCLLAVQETLVCLKFY